MTEFSAQLSPFGAAPSLRTVCGAVNSSDPKTGSRMWQPMSPNVAVPKSTRLRQFNGWYTSGMYGRGVATPIQESQFNVAGGELVSFGSGSVSPHFLSLHEWTSF